MSDELEEKKDPSDDNFAPPGKVVGEGEAATVPDEGEEQDTEPKTKAEFMEALDTLGIKYPDGAKLAELIVLYKKAMGTEDEPDKPVPSPVSRKATTAPQEEAPLDPAAPIGSLLDEENYSSLSAKGKGQRAFYQKETLVQFMLQGEAWERKKKRKTRRFSINSYPFRVELDKLVSLPQHFVEYISSIYGLNIDALNHPTNLAAHHKGKEAD